MAKAPKFAISPTRAENYPEWYLEVIKAADLAEHSPVRGCMIIKPWGYSIWENLQKILDGKIKETGHQNAYFPLFIPLSFLEKEAEHVEGFAKECAVVTHHRLEKKGGKLVPAGPLEEPLIVRPTSEMIIGEAFSRWVESYRDLPLLINQWANVVRWEMRTRLFLRTTEFLWQEGHTVHASKEEAEEETLKMLGVYVDFAKNYLGIPVIPGQKTAAERFPGAVTTYSIEAMMQDKKALQCGTSHFLGQNFAKSCNIQFQNVNGDLQHGWTTSWGVTTRLIGGLVMTHGDDDGLVLPPRIAPSHIVILPILHDETTKAKVLAYCHKLKEELQSHTYSGEKIRVIVDERDLRGGEKNWSWIKKGIPVRVEIGAREVDAHNVCVYQRNKGHRDSQVMGHKEFVEGAAKRLQGIQDDLLHKATAFRDQNMIKLENKKDLYDFFTPKNAEKPEIHGGFALCHYFEDKEVEEKIKEDLNVTVRCLPLATHEEKGSCVISSKPSVRRAIFAKSY